MVTGRRATARMADDDEAMLDDLGLPRERETGLKLIRRSVSQIARPRIGEAQWRQGELHNVNTEI